jgi:hypothetical protein
VSLEIRNPSEDELRKAMTTGALQRASDLFRTGRLPFCPEDF